MATDTRPNRSPIHLDPTLLAAAQKALGTQGKQDTVTAALERVVREDLWQQELEHARSGGYDELADAAFRASLWERDVTGA